MTTVATRARDAALRCEAKKHAYRQVQDGVVVSFVLHPQEVPDGLAIAPLGTRYMMALVEIGDDEEPISREEVRPDQSERVSKHRSTDKTGAGEKQHREWSSLPPAQQAGIRCNEPAFWKFLSEQNYFGDDGNFALIEDADKAAVYVRLACSVNSRANIGKGRATLARWNRLEAQFQDWLRDPVPA